MESLIPQTPILPPGDEGYCGLDLSPNGPDLETGKWDPYYERACKPHDAAFDELKDGNPSQSNLETAGLFIVDSSIVALTGAYDVLKSPIDLIKGKPLEDVGSQVAKGIYSVATYPIYFTVGGIGGALRWAYLEASLGDGS